MSSVEDIIHILSSYPQMLPRFYLPLRHNELVKPFSYSYIKNNKSDKKIKLGSESEYIHIEEPRDQQKQISQA